MEHQEQLGFKENRGKGAPTVSKSSKNKKRNQKYIYGNYHAYYGYRIDSQESEDPRLKVFRKEWFEGKDCLDIGCNAGIITMSIARKFGCRSIHGVDIDPFLIGRARENLQLVAGVQNLDDEVKKVSALKKARLQKLFQKERRENGEFSCSSSCADENSGGEGEGENPRTDLDGVSTNGRKENRVTDDDDDDTATQEVTENRYMDSPAHEREDPRTDSNGISTNRSRENVATDNEHDATACLEISKNGNIMSTSPENFNKVTFKTENFIDTPVYPHNGKFDTVLCLSVTKWIHLNWGDKGLIKLFAKIWRVLKPGGIFVLEPQPWKSYLRNRLVSEETAKIFWEITYRPEDFRNLLLDKIGFRTMERIDSSVSNSTKGFDRPIYVLQK